MSSKKWPTLKAAGYTIVVIDQHTEAVATGQKPGVPINFRPRLSVSGGRDAINILRAVTDTGERVVALTPDTFSAVVSRHFLRVLQQQFGKKLAIVVDNTLYFIVKALTKQAAKDGPLPE